MVHGPDDIGLMSAGRNHLASALLLSKIEHRKARTWHALRHSIPSSSTPATCITITIDALRATTSRAIIVAPAPADDRAASIAQG